MPHALPHLPVLTPHDPFPAAHQAWGRDSPIPGLLCAGADLSVARLVQAYSQGLFPWFSEGDPILWWSPDPRMVLKVADFKRHRSLQQAIKQFHATPRCRLTMDHAFAAVIEQCANTKRAGQNGTWIVPSMQAAYLALHRAGYAHSVEVWEGEQLIGGLYFTQIGRAVFGESMFSGRSNASKIALSALVDFCAQQQIEWIDCQQQTAHLASLGAKPIPRAVFVQMVERTLAVPPSPSPSPSPAPSL